MVWPHIVWYYLGSFVHKPQHSIRSLSLFFFFIKVFLGKIIKATKAPDVKNCTWVKQKLLNKCVILFTQPASFDRPPGVSPLTWGVQTADRQKCEHLEWVLYMKQLSLLLFSNLSLPFRSFTSRACSTWLTSRALPLIENHMKY